MNKIDFKPFKKDTIIYVEFYKIDSYETVNTPYEGHYLHYNTQTNTTISQQKVYAGNILVPTNQPGFRYLLETLELRAVDSFLTGISLTLSYDRKRVVRHLYLRILV
ncbi:hypothetical protein [Maribacter antarcticus]|uniref:hypothetical protein n=1 Tax=Maribacter antarcticus TaxID=505250 RepID=UPI00047C4788|nr:hypothetical protein [Maribacter antarcticus]